jgi:MGT family glycosyltransferase
MRVLAVVIPERGHINPLAPTLQALEAAGHGVVVASVADTADVFAHLAEHGVGARVVRLRCPPPPAALHRSGRALAETIRDPGRLAVWIEALLLDGVDDVVTAVAEALHDERPDVVIIDPMLYGAVIAAERHGVPWVALSSSLNPVTPSTWRVPLTNTLRALSARREQAFHRHGVAPPRFMVADAISPWLTITFSVDAYAPRHDADADDVFALGAPFPLTAKTGEGLGAHEARRGLYVSFGSQAYFQPALFRGVFAAAHRVGLDVIASVGDLVDDDAFVAAAPAGARLYRYAPQRDIVPTVAVVVSHGGANSVVETLAAATPLVLLPLCNDQHLQARFLSASGAGVVVDVGDGAVVDDAMVDAIAKAVVDAQSEERHQALQAIAHAIAGAGGPRRAAALIIEVASTRTPLKARAP